MEPPLVSIVTPSYNEQDFIESTLKSVREQEYSNVEHIVVDGGSTDKTLDTLKEYEGTYNLSWISEPDDGLYDAIAKGFNRANGDIYAWLNANDFYLPWAADVAVDHLSQDGVQWITGRSATANEEGQVKHVSRIQTYYKQSWIRKGWYHGRSLGWFCQPSMFWTTELWDAVGRFPEDKDLAGEHYLWREFAKVSGLRSVNTVLGVHRTHEGQLSENIEEWYDEANPHPLTSILSKLEINTFYSLYCILKQRGNQ